ncbi:MAG: protein kinase [Nanoarchaeota archaeon]
MKLIDGTHFEPTITISDLDSPALEELLSRGYQPQKKLGEGSNRKAFKVTRQRGHFIEELVAKVPKLEFDINTIKKEIAAEKQRNGRNWNVQEAIMSTKLWHPNLARTIDSFDLKDERTVNVEPYYEGSRGLRGEIKLLQEGLPLQAYKGIMTGILAGVGHMHKNGILHRDLSPDNVIVDKHGTAVVTDLQTAAFEGQSIPSLTPTQGRIDYTEPRLVNALLNGKAETATDRSDLYSIGAIGYYLLTGKEPSSYHLVETANGSPIQIGNRVVHVSLRRGDTEVKEISSKERRFQLNSMIKVMSEKGIPKQHRSFVLGCMEE